MNLIKSRSLNIISYYILPKGSMEKANPFEQVKQEVEVDGHKYTYYSLQALKDERVNKLPYSIRVLLESAIRNCDEFNVKSMFFFLIYVIRIFRV